ncbi:MAG TPA: asparagine synthase (glutamine-hydrolyzing) [Candidatus Jacksonbacteria bacterium]|nr:MAG: Asparagine synthetase [Parcubacteria group bacterium GW2011_GWC2_44_22]OGY74649.1 MAG: asparagine synthase (glutamine-hydrolyzing) [Candidatus Jacksonbacteria bacterium RIFOXYA2_FULL_43_12]OGY75352.1 MAG: asparagine synthase (glutamine-hydrolyzing) [Candidatus Jacksonbacteria bacterium RIFOXYB2_FULL_44_15]OGY82038.1 MAG: asparagine synthase (glutamine-hydrolyzing) [Candidatus Jacksonbacteria bacterium RIFOXYD2_FULL_43_21]HBH45857.1 asparagine synthase (glutamine-hydrolyzing) [Candidatus
MCGIAGKLNLKFKPDLNLARQIKVMNTLQTHRGPDGEGYWIQRNHFLGFGHRRLSIIDLASGSQPMTDDYKCTITFNGEIYNYRDLKKSLALFYKFKTSSDTEVILAAYNKWGSDCVQHLRGMFAFAIWDEMTQTLFCARDRFGIKPFYYTTQNSNFIFASEAKALLPFLSSIKTDIQALKDYFAFQFCLGEKTLFQQVLQLEPAHYLIIKNNQIKIKKYWEVNFKIDWQHDEKYFQNQVQQLLNDSIRYHLQSDVEVGAYLSGGLDSSLIATLAQKHLKQKKIQVFNGKFSLNNEYDESKYAQALARKNHSQLWEIDIKARDFIKNINKVIYHLDYPVGGPGSFPQYQVSQFASKHLKVVLGGQGGDEIFGGYVRYLLAYFEQCIKGAIDGTMNSGNFVVTYASIIPNLAILKNYQPLMQEFWSDELFGSRDRRYFKLINRANNLHQEINWELLEPYSAFQNFQKIFWASNVEKESYFDSMTHFDFKTLLPALLQVEDRMSMAHGLESRVPFLDHPLIELVATIPANIKFANGELKHLLRSTFSSLLPPMIANRQDKMGFPVPLSEWLKGELKEYVTDIFTTAKAKIREYLNPQFDIRSLMQNEGQYSRKVWGLLSLELWQQEFHDKANYYNNLLKHPK